MRRLTHHPRENNVSLQLSILTIARFYMNPQTEIFCQLLELDVAKMPR
jgi:hypothetical protein